MTTTSLNIYGMQDIEAVCAQAAKQGLSAKADPEAATRILENAIDLAQEHKHSNPVLAGYGVLAMHSLVSDYDEDISRDVRPDIGILPILILRQLTWICIKENPSCRTASSRLSQRKRQVFSRVMHLRRNLRRPIPMPLQLRIKY